MSSSHTDKLDEILASLRDEEFELLVRRYVERQLARLEKPTFTTLTFAQTYNSSDPYKIQWSIGLYGDTNTKGEILSECVTEQNRRTGFTKTCTLRLIEGTVGPTVEAAPTTVDEITF